MNEIAWRIIDGLCHTIERIFVLLFIFGDFTANDFLKISGLAIGGVLSALIIGRFLF